MINDALDSYWKYVKPRIIANNPQRTVVGIIEANEWPPKQVQFNSFYLLALGETPSRGFGSKTNRGLTYLVQWMWLIPGDDKAQGTMGKNRGNRYRIHYQMKSELGQASYPGFCDKNTYTAPAAPGLPATATALGEKIWWSPLRFMPSHLEEKSGLLQGSAQVHINSFGDVITS